MQLSLLLLLKEGIRVRETTKATFHGKKEQKITFPNSRPLKLATGVGVTTKVARFVLNTF